MSERTIQVGLAGFGMSGQVFHAPFISADPRFTLKKVYERTTDKAKQAYPDVEIVRTFEELLTEDIDLVVISTPNQYHVPMAAQAIRAGKNVIVEKPAAVTSQEAEELCRMAKEQGVLFSIYQNRRLDGDYLTVKKLIESGRLGEVVDYECHFDRFVTGQSAKQWKREGGKGINILYDLGIHLIDQAYALFGTPDEVYADMRKQRPESSGIDNFEVSLYYPDKKVILSASELVAMPGPRFMVHGRKGSFVKYGQDPQERSLISGMRPGGSDWGADAENHYGILAVAAEDGISQETIVTEAGNYGRYYDNFYHALRSGRELLVKPEEAVDVLRIVEAAQESQDQKQRIRLKSGIRKESSEV